MEIIYEDCDLLAVNKPAGLVVHPDAHHKKETLIDKIIEIRPEIKKVGDNSARPGIVHRLDKDTSGVLLIAKNQETFNYLKKQFQHQKISGFSRRRSQAKKRRNKFADWPRQKKSS